MANTLIVCLTGINAPISKAPPPSFKNHKPANLSVIITTHRMVPPLFEHTSMECSL